MATDYPTQVDTIDDAPATLAGLPTHSDLHNSLRDAVQAVQTMVGTTGSAKVIQRFANVSARNAAIPIPAAGMIAWTDAEQSLWIYRSSWIEFSSQWLDAITITLTGDATGSVSIDGSANKSLAVTVADNSHSHTGSTISGLDAGDTTTGVFATARVPNLDAAKIVSGIFALARLPTDITGRTLVESDKFEADTDGSAAAPVFTWDSDPDLGMFRRSWSSGGTNDALGHTAQGVEVHRMWRNASSGAVFAAFNTDMDGVVGGTTMEMETISIDGANRKRYGFATSKRATKTNEQPFDGLTDDQWDALQPKTFVIRGKYVVDGDHITYLDAGDAPDDAVPLRRLGLVWEDTAAVSPELVTPDAPDWHALTSACLAEIKNLRRRLDLLEGA